MNFRRKLLLIWLGAALLVGLCVQPLLPGTSSARSDGESLASFGENLGKGITLAVLGGYRNVAANFVWLSMYGDWQYRRKAEVLKKMELAVTLNANALYFWVDGSRIIANDMPVWQVGEAAMESLFVEPSGIEIRKQYGEQALRFLEDAPGELATQIPILLEKAVICWQRLADLDRALTYLEMAVARSDVPYYVCRVYAELLIKDGRKQKAYEYLKAHYASLPDSDQRAMKPLVARRIAELENELRSVQGL